MDRFLSLLLSIHVLFFCCYISSSSAQNDPVLAMRYSTQCNVLNDCDIPNSRFKMGEAYDCRDGECICHPDATYKEDLHQCQCNKGFVKSGRICILASPSPQPEVEARAGPPAGAAPPVPAAAPLCTPTSCKENEECLPGGCACKSDYVHVGGICKLAARRVGDPCEHHEQCRAKLGGYSSCYEGRCVCEDVSVPVSNGEECMLKKGLLEPCKHEDQCTHIPNARCATDICLCRETHVPNQNSSSCVPVVNILEGSCETSIQCHKGSLGPGSECVKTSLDEGRCACLKQTYFYNRDVKKCLMVRGHGEQCDNKDTGCYLPDDKDNQGIECKKGTCQCKKKYVLSADKKHCNSGFKLQSSIFFTIVSIILTRRW